MKKLLAGLLIVGLANVGLAQTPMNIVRPTIISNNFTVISNQVVLGTLTVTTVRVTGNERVNGNLDVDGAFTSVNARITGTLNLSNTIVNGQFVNNTNIVTDAITSNKIATDAVNSDEIAASAVGTSELATNSVNGGKIIDFSITSNDVAGATIDRSKLTALYWQEGNWAGNLYPSLRVLGGTYNNTSWPIAVSVTVYNGGAGTEQVNWQAGAMNGAHTFRGAGASYYTIFFTVPAGYNYSVYSGSGTITILYWYESVWSG